MRIAVVRVVSAMFAVASCSPSDPDLAGTAAPDATGRADTSQSSVLDFGLDASTAPEVQTDLEGVALAGPTGLRLLSDHLSVIDVDSGTSHRIIWLPNQTDVWWAEQQGRRVIVTLDCVDCPVRPAVFVLDDGDYTAEPVATGMFVTAGLNATLWAKTYATRSSCRLGRIGVDGEIVDSLRPVSCDTNVIADSAVGLVATLGDDPAVLNRSDFSAIRRWRSPIRLHAIVGGRALLSKHGRFTLVDIDTGADVPVAAPRAVGQPGPGAVSPDGRYVAVEYRSPAQIMDLWLLDVASLQWIHAPSMPVHALIKRPAPVWTPDGRLAVVGHFGAEPSRDHVLVVWHPDDPHLALLNVSDDAQYVLT
jgi:hypothetical protein